MPNFLVGRNRDERGPSSRCNPNPKRMRFELNLLRQQQESEHEYSSDHEQEEHLQIDDNDDDYHDDDHAVMMSPSPTFPAVSPNPSYDHHQVVSDVAAIAGNDGEHGGETEVSMEDEFEHRRSYEGEGGGEEEEEDEEQEEDELVISSPAPTSPINSGGNNEAYEVATVADNDGDDERCRVMTLSDPGVLDCPICLNPLTVRVFQCENGHIACSSCSTKVSNKCPSCDLPIGYNRCRAIEKVIESVKISCRNFKYGCMEKTIYCNKNEHENTCAYAPCSCPKLHCTFVGSLKQLSAHVINKHPYITKRFHFDNSFPITLHEDEKYIILRENEGQLFILNREIKSLGSVITISCIQPSASKEEFSYIVVAKTGGCVLKLESVADNVAGRLENPDQRRFLMVPWDFVDSWGELDIEVNIMNQLPKTPPRVVTVRSPDP